MLFPHASLTVFFAITTGVFLWLSSLATGWTANYLALHKMASAISNSLRIRQKLGTARAAKPVNFVRHHAAGSVGYIVLAFLLGAVPIIFELFGIPLEVAASRLQPPVSAMLLRVFDSTDSCTGKMRFLRSPVLQSLHCSTSLFCAELSLSNTGSQYR
jgi:site-specific recombinase